MAKGLKTRKSSPSRFKIQDSVLGYATILPAMLVLIGFFGYPLFYEVYASFTNSTVGQPGEWVLIHQFYWLLSSSC
jgi:ABC-type sugar transport system permease subunit